MINGDAIKGSTGLYPIESSEGVAIAEGESTLDIEMVAGLAPAASIEVYQTDGNADDPWTQVNDELQHIIDANTGNANAGSVVNISLGIDEADITPDDVRALDGSLQQLTQVEHMTVFVASGDCGAFADETYGDLSVSYPASDPWAVAIGGTEVSVNAQHQRADEVVWSAQFPNIFHCRNSWGTSGNNLYYPATPGWDYATGLGRPNLASFDQAASNTLAV